MHVRAVGERDRPLGALLDEEHGEPRLADLAERLEDDVDDLRSEAERRLVEQENVGLRDERARDRKLLLLAAGERAGVATAEFLEDREELVRLLERVAVRALAACGEAEPEVLHHRQLTEDAASLGHERDSAPGDALGADADERRAVVPDVAADDGCGAHDRVERRRLPRAVRADETDDLAAPDDERKAAHRLDGAVADTEVLELQGGNRAGTDARSLRLRRRALAEICSRHAEVGADLCRRPLRECHALVEHVDPVADVEDERDVVVDEQDAGAVLLHGANRGGEARDLRLGEPRGRLVHEHEARLGGERASDAEPPLVTVRDRRRGLARIRGQVEEREKLVGAPRGLPLRGADAERGDLDVLPHRQPAEGVAVLERPRETVAAAPVRRPARDVAVLEQHAPLRRPVEAAENVDERGLPGAVRADQPDDLALPQLERDVTQTPRPRRTNGRRRRPGVFLRASPFLMDGASVKP